MIWHMNFDLGIFIGLYLYRHIGGRKGMRMQNLEGLEGVEGGVYEGST